MPSMYLQGDDKVLYGAANATDQEIAVSSTLIDGYINRLEGLLYSTDANGDACYMSALNPSITLTLTSGITAGLNVNVPVTGGIIVLKPGMVCILDRANPSLTEACVIHSITGNVIQFKSVQFDHSNDCKLEFGLTLYDENALPSGRNVTYLSRKPVMRVLSAEGRYGYRRRGDSYLGYQNQNELLSSLNVFSPGVPDWVYIDPNQIQFSSPTGEIWFPSGIYQANFTDVHIYYIAGYTYATLPSVIKQATARIYNAQSFMMLNGSIRKLTAGDTSIEYASATYIDEDIKMMLLPYIVNYFGY